MIETAYPTRTCEEGEAETSRRYTLTTESGYEVTVERLTEGDLRRSLSEFEAKYGMTSKEFVKRWSAGELDCAVMDYFKWESCCYSLAMVYGADELKVPNQGVGELRFEYPPGDALKV